MYILNFILFKKKIFFQTINELLAMLEVTDEVKKK